MNELNRIFHARTRLDGYRSCGDSLDRQTTQEDVAAAAAADEGGRNAERRARQGAVNQRLAPTSRDWPRRTGSGPESQLASEQRRLRAEMSAMRAREEARCLEASLRADHSPDRGAATGTACRGELVQPRLSDPSLSPADVPSGGADPPKPLPLCDVYIHVAPSAIYFGKLPIHHSLCPSRPEVFGVALVNAAGVNTMLVYFPWDGKRFVITFAPGLGGMVIERGGVPATYAILNVTYNPRDVELYTENAERAYVLCTDRRDRETLLRNVHGGWVTFGVGEQALGQKFVRKFEEIKEKGGGKEGSGI